MRKKYFTDEERKAAKNASWKRWKKNNPEKVKAKNKRWAEEHPEKVSEMNKRWRKNNPDHIVEYGVEYRSTLNGRASSLLGGYRRDDKAKNRGECTLTIEWIVDNVFSGQCCHYCGESDWQLLGVDRIDNTKPHTPENVVPCCGMCNIKRGTTEYSEFMRLIGKTN